MLAYDDDDNDGDDDDDDDATDSNGHYNCVYIKRNNLSIRKIKKK